MKPGAVQGLPRSVFAELPFRTFRTLDSDLELILSATGKHRPPALLGAVFPLPGAPRRRVRVGRRSVQGLSANAAT